MLRGKGRERIFRILICTVFMTTLILLGCGKDDDDNGSSSKPEIVGCNSVKYNGYTFNNIGCAPGIASFDVQITQNGHSGNFHITCSNGCVATVTVKSGSTSKTLTGPR